ncbi:hypothetical protein Clacol_003258 [Clathrus columnatus]|uniref:Acyclic terpene utilisation N-terminal domain-containing protein n=1 Tax=Clathrus columnatus TaxID=1419009 RepID=A0AAV5A8Z8_9AGAM|nr:hypothetical protein Clacol_003258 [Clathrus columnatus]
MTRPVLIGNVSAATGDRLDAISRMLTGTYKVDALVGDWLSEMNLSWRAFEHMKDPQKGYDEHFLQSFKLAAEEFASQNVKLVVNAGAFNPRGLVVQVERILAQYGDKGKAKVVAWIEGDNVEAQCRDHPEEIRHLHDGTSLKEWKLQAPGELLGPLQEGADIVIAGRITDASPVMALAAWWHGWQQHELDKMAQALAAGHILECGTYVTGGNFSGFKSALSNFFDLGHPIAQISDDGTTIITKQPCDNGYITVETMTCQILYEIQGPFYYNSDVIADLTNISFTEEGPDRIRICNVRGLPAPETLKVVLQGHGGYQGELAFHPTGLDIKEKFESFKLMTERILKDDLVNGDLTLLECQLYGSEVIDPRSQREATAYIRIFFQGKTEEVVRRAGVLALSNYIQGYPGVMPNLDTRLAQPKPFLILWPGVISRSMVIQTVHIKDRVIQVEESMPITPLLELPKQPSYEPTSPIPLPNFGPTVPAPLGHVVYARKQLKKWHWLRNFLSSAMLRRLLAHDAARVRKIERCEFPNLRVVHFVLHGILETGVGSTAVLDSLGKNVAEFLRARVVDIPSQFYNLKAKI